MKAFSTAVLVGFLVLTTADGADDRDGSSSYVVDAYDPKRNPEDDLRTAVEKAKASGKRILVQVGGDWCGWCHLIIKYFKEDQKVAAALAKSYMIVKVNYSDENQNKEFLSKYPRIKAYPHICILDV